MNYENLKNQLILEIQVIVNEYANSGNIKIENHLPDNYLYFVNDEQYTFVCNEIKNKFNKIIKEIFMTLFREKNEKITVFTFSKENQKKDINDFFSIFKNQPLFSFLIKNDIDNSFQLCMVKEFGINKRLPNEALNICINSIKNTLNININKYFYLSEVDSLAYTEQFNYEESVDDESKGTNIYSMGNYIKAEFGNEEYSKFIEFISNINTYLKNNFGYSIIKNLIPNSLFGYKKDVEIKLKTFDYLNGIKSIDSSFNQYEMLYGRYNRFIDFILLDKDFSISFVTAEWLFDSLKKNARIDLTVIAMGFLKSIEQLLSYVMFLYANGNFIVPLYENNNFNTPTKEFKLTKEYYRSKKNKLTIQNIKDFYKYEKNEDIYYTDIGGCSKKIFFKLLDNIQSLRNGYFHKDNIVGEEGIKKVSEIRCNTFLLFYFIFSIIKFNEWQISRMSLRSKKTYEELCEYVNYNYSKLYYITFKDDKSIVAIGQPDRKIKFNKDGEAIYSGLYFIKYKNVSVSKQIISLKDITTINTEQINLSSEDSILKIEIGYLKPCAEGLELSGPIEVLYDNNLFFK